MKKQLFVFLCFGWLMAINTFAQKDIRFINTEKLLSPKEEIALGKAIRYEADFFNRLFPEKTVNIADIKFTVVTGFADLMNMQLQIGSTAHISSGFFRPMDSLLVVLKTKKTPSAQFLSTCYHEMAHAFLSLHAGKSYLPPWFNEGLAVYLERMSFEKSKIAHQVDETKIKRVKTLIELRDLYLLEFADWDYPQFSTESFSQENYGYCVGYCMVYFLMQKDEDNAIEIFRDLIGKRSSIKTFNRYYPGGFAQFEKEFVEYFGKDK
ncbi:MAG: DUF1570 domain-containing protein [Dysgonamonadaceae bacterium]|jgi:uncharacterized protein YjaZ|nr:DUF1570 domain-containing protein [Dysgonamonadaceae bacterium]